MNLKSVFWGMKNLQNWVDLAFKCKWVINDKSVPTSHYVCRGNSFHYFKKLKREEVYCTSENCKIWNKKTVPPFWHHCISLEQALDILKIQFYGNLYIFMGKSCNCRNFSNLTRPLINVNKPFLAKIVISFALILLACPKFLVIYFSLIINAQPN